MNGSVRPSVRLSVCLSASLSCLSVWLSVCLSVCLSDCLSVCLSVCSSVCHIFLTMFLSSCHQEICRSDCHWQEWCPYKRSRSEVKTQNPIYPFPDHESRLNSHMATKWCTKLNVAKERCPIVIQGHPSNFKVTRHKKSPTLIPIGHFRL